MRLRRQACSQPCASTSKLPLPDPFLIYKDNEDDACAFRLMNDAIHAFHNPRFSCPPGAARFMASRPDYLPTYDAQSFPIQMAHNQPFVPPADYPMDELMMRPKRPRSPPMDYRGDYGQYPFRTYGDGQSYRHSTQ